MNEDTVTGCVFTIIIVLLFLTLVYLLPGVR